MKLRTKILLMCIGCTLMALVLQTYLYQKTSVALIYEQAKKESENSMQNMQNEIYTFIKKMETNLIRIYNEEDIVKALEKNQDINSMKNEFSRKAGDVATRVFSTNEGVLAVYIYNRDNVVISTYRKAETPKHNYPVDIYDDEEAYNVQAITDYIESDATGVLLSSYYNQYREKDIVRFTLKIYDDRMLKNVIGYVVCDLDSQVFETIIKKYMIDDSMFIWLQPTGDRAMITVGKQKEEEIFEQISSNITNGNLSETNTIEEKQEFFQIEQKKYNLVAYSLMPQELLKHNQKTLTVNLLMIAVLMIILSIFLSYALSKTVTRKLYKLMNVMKKIKEGNTHLRTKLDSKDEIGQLGSNFNTMLDRIEELAEKENKANLLLVESQYKALQAQINPHFLYNTLEAMSGMAEVMEVPEVGNMAQALSNMFHYNLNMKEQFVSVGKEIAHLKNYCYVMNIRMQNQVQYIYEIDNAALQVSIPKMSLQPIVENSIQHGLQNKRGEKEICVKAEIKEDVLVICISDNGIGLNPKELNESLRKNDIEYIEKGESIGLHNINARLKILYKDQYTVHIESEVGVGTKVFMTIPYTKSEEKGSETKEI